ncbi:CDD deaminase [Biomphalaria glabrata]
MQLITIHQRPSVVQVVGIFREIEVRLEKLCCKGRSILVYEGFEFWLKKKALNGNMNWRCSKYQTHKCLVTLVTAQDDVINQSSTHNHECNRGKAIAKNALEKMKEKMSETTTTPGACQADVIVDLPPSVLMALSRKKCYKQDSQTTS